MPKNGQLRGSSLHRTLSVWGALGLSVALLGPSMAANINPQAPAQHVGAAVPLVFALSTIAVLFVAYAFIRLCQHFAHAGSVYGFVAATLGPRSGFVAGWLLLGTYIAFTVTTLAGSALFLTTFLQSTGLWADANWLVPAAAAFSGVCYLASRPTRSATRILLIVELATMVLIVVVAAIVLFRLATHQAPSGQTLSTSIFQLPEGGMSAVFFAMTFGFLSFAGFEAASTLGEETHNPKRAIPLALLGTVVVAGIFFFFVTSAESLGFGTGEAGVQAFVNSQSLMGDLGNIYVGTWLGDSVTLGAGLSAFASALACAVGASRLLFAMGRDGFIHPRLGQARDRDGVPVASLTVVLLVAATAIVCMRIFATSDVTDVFFWAATLGSLALMTAYLLCLTGAIRFLFFTVPRRVRRAEIIIPAAGMLLIAYTLYNNVYPVPDAPYNVFPYVVGAWLMIGFILVLVLPGLAARIGEQFLESETASGDTEVSSPCSMPNSTPGTDSDQPGNHTENADRPPRESIHGRHHR